MKIALRPNDGYTLIELLMVIVIVGVATVAYEAVVAKYGKGQAVVASGVVLVFSVWLVALFYRWSWNRDKRTLAKLREKYRTVYQLKELPAAAKSMVKPEAAEIQIGDYGWEAHPLRRDGLVYLQGLTPRWQVVWHAGFRPEQLEKVAEKPTSQYDYWRPDWARKLQHPTPPPPLCAFSVRERSTPTMGLPHHSGHYFKDYPSQFYQSPSAVESATKVPLLTDKYRAQSRALARHSQIWMVLSLATLFGISQVCFNMDRAKPALWIQILTGCGIFSVPVIYFFLCRMTAKRIAKKHEIRCPVCGNEITARRLAGWPRRELCNRCGTKVIECILSPRFQHLNRPPETLPT